MLAALVLLAGCANPVPSTSGGDGTPVAGDDLLTGSEALPGADPAFAAHFSDPIYEDPANEFAPFGTDEGWDILHEWAERRGDLHSTTTVAELISESGFDEIVSQLDTEAAQGTPEPGGAVDAATIVVGTGFTLLRLSGRIDDAGRQLTLDALDVLIRQYGSPEELLRQRSDLEAWTPGHEQDQANAAPARRRGENILGD